MEEKGGAKFDKTKKVLTVTLPVSRKDIALPRPIPPIPSSDDIGAGKKTEKEEEAQKTKKGEEEGGGEAVEGTKVDTPLSSHKGEPRKPEKGKKNKGCPLLLSCPFLILIPSCFTF